MKPAAKAAQKKGAAFAILPSMRCPPHHESEPPACQMEPLPSRQPRRWVGLPDTRGRRVPSDRQVCGGAGWD